MGITEFIAAWGTQVVDAAGYPGVFFLMVLESMIPPIPSEAILPFVGFLIAEGSMSAAAALVLATLGSLVGALAFYALGRYGGRPLVTRYGRVFRLDERSLDKAEAFFRRRGGITILVARFIPLLRPLISIPAGMAKMKLVPFCFFTIAGAAAWNGILVACGVVLRQNWDAVMRYSQWLDIAVAVAVSGLIVYGVIRFLKRRKRREI
jgi:membrane protein DedA with SNARE-associated domain